MQKRQPGNSDLEVSALELVCIRMTFGDAPVGTRDERKGSDDSNYI